MSTSEFHGILSSCIPGTSEGQQWFAHLQRPFPCSTCLSSPPLQTWAKVHTRITWRAEKMPWVGLPQISWIRISSTKFFKNSQSDSTVKFQWRITDLVQLSSVLQVSKQNSGNGPRTTALVPTPRSSPLAFPCFLYLDPSISRGPVPNSLCLPHSPPAPGVFPAVLGTKWARTDWDTWKLLDSQSQPLPSPHLHAHAFSLSKINRSLKKFLDGKIGENLWQWIRQP